MVYGLAKAYVGTEIIEVCATVPDLGSLAREIGSDRVSVTVFAKGTEDPHFIEARPSFIKAMSQCEIYIQTGLELERGWAPVLLQNARNGQILPGAPGFLDASIVITPIEIPDQPVDRSIGDVHPFGNPHYLLDPINGLRVANVIRTKLVELRPSDRPHFDSRFDAFARRIANSLIGEALASKYSVEDVQKLAQLFEHDKLVAYLKRQEEAALLGGWLGMMVPYYGTRVVDDHNIWPYFARRFGLQVVGHMEPKPGIPPTTRHLQGLIERMRAERVKVAIIAAYYDPRHAQFITEKTGVTAVPLAHQVGARPGTDDYLSLIDYNVRQLAMALGSKR
jgi:ABC-type metal ion transport system, periplasmic component/surface adhesin